MGVSWSLFISTSSLDRRHYRKNKYLMVPVHVFSRVAGIRIFIFIIQVLALTFSCALNSLDYVVDGMVALPHQEYRRKAQQFRILQVCR